MIRPMAKSKCSVVVALFQWPISLPHWEYLMPKGEEAIPLLLSRYDTP